MKNNSLNRFAICLNNKGSEDLIVRKVYQILPDEQAEKKGLLRVVTATGDIRITLTNDDTGTKP